MKGWIKKIDPKKLRKYSANGDLAIGIFRDTQDYEDLGVSQHPGFISKIVMVAYIHEFGLGVTARPWLKKSVEADRRFYDKEVKDLLKKAGKNRQKRSDLLDELGQTGRNKVRAHLWRNDVGLKDNTKITKQMKGGQQPMIDSEHLVRHIAYKAKEQ